MSRIESETGQMRGQETPEAELAKPIEKLTVRLSSDTFLWLAGGSILASLTLKYMRRDTDASFVGQWAPTFLIFGAYLKLVKLLEHDRSE
jgi:fatty acid desaturase